MIGMLVGILAICGMVFLFGLAVASLDLIIEFLGAVFVLAYAALALMACGVIFAGWALVNGFTCKGPRPF